MRHTYRFVRVAGNRVALLLTVALLAGCSASTEPTVQLNFPEGMKLPEPAKDIVVVPGAGPMSQGDPHNYTK